MSTGRCTGPPGVVGGGWLPIGTRPGGVVAAGVPGGVVPGGVAGGAAACPMSLP